MIKSPEAAEPTMFRIHMQADQVDVTATSAHEAREMAKKLRPGAIITKVKVLKEGAEA
jgi:hypothetical protein